MSSCVKSKLARASACKFWASIAIVLIRKMGRPLFVQSVGHHGSEREPRLFSRESGELPMRPKYIRVRARSEYEGSGTAASSLAGPEAVCFPIAELIMIRVAWQFFLL